MNILYHHRTLGDGAEGIHIQEMVNAFRALGHMVKVISPMGRKTNEKDEKYINLSKFKALMPSIFFELLEIGYNVFGYYNLSKHVKSFNPDFIYDRYITYNASAILIGKKFRIPVVLEVNAPLALERSQQKDEKLYFKRTAMDFERWIYSNSTKTIVVSTPLKEYLTSIGVPENKIIIMPNGVNLKNFRPTAAKDKYLMNELEIKKDNWVIGFVGILRPWHGVDLLLDAFRELSRIKPDVHLLIVGDGPIKNDVLQKIQEYGLSKRVSITGRVSHEEIPRYINLFDIAVSPKTTFYASPMKILEYMAMKKAVVAPNTDNIKDIISHNKDGILFSPNDSDSLKDSIICLIKNTDKATKIAENAKRKVLKEFNWPRNAQKVIEFVETIRQ